MNKEKTIDERLDEFARSLIMFIDITYTEAREIGIAKLKYKEKEICFLEKQQEAKYTDDRYYLIHELLMIDPLKCIENEYHARNVINAHYRHSRTNYDRYLDEGRRIRESAIPTNIRTYAREKIKADGYCLIY